MAKRTARLSGSVWLVSCAVPLLLLSAAGARADTFAEIVAKARQKAADAANRATGSAAPGATAGATSAASGSRQGATGTRAASLAEPLKASAKEQVLAPDSSQGFLAAVSSDGERAATGSLQGSRTIVTVDGQISRPFDSVDHGYVAFSPGGKHVAYVARSGGDSLVVVDNKDGPAFAAIVDTRNHPTFVYQPFVFSADGNHVAYVGKSADNKYHVVLDGVLAPEQGFIEQMVFAGGKLVCITQENGEKHVVVDGKKSPSYASVDAVLTNADGHSVYSASSGKKLLLVFDGVEQDVQGTDPSVFNIQLSEHGKHFAYRLRASDHDRKITQFYDGKPVGEGISLVMSPDGSRYALVSPFPESENEAVLTSGSYKSPVYAGFQGIVFSANSSRLAFVGTSGGKQFAVIDGKESSAYTIVQELQYSRDGKHVAFVGRMPDHYNVVVDGVEGLPMSTIDEHSLTFSPDGAHYAYSGTVRGAPQQTTLIVDGQPQALNKNLGSFKRQMPRPGTEPEARFAFAPGTSKVAYVEEHADGSGLSSVGFNGKSGPGGYVFTSPAFSPDGDHLACMEWFSNAWYLLVDGKSLPLNADFVETPNALVFKSNNSVRYLASKDGAIRSVLVSF